MKYSQGLNYKPSIILIGPPGAGKSTLCELLAPKMSMEPIDTDSIIQKTTKMSIAEIFKKKGESFFREKENLLQKELLAKPNAIIACGGGFFRNLQEVSTFKERHCVIYIQASLMCLYNRLINSKTKRPLLKKENLTKNISKLIFLRDFIYKMAHFSIDNSSFSPEEACLQIENHYQSFISL